jgi:phospholipid/cholesterol/gamma-HCH transport system permease protein
MKQISINNDRLMLSGVLDTKNVTDIYSELSRLPLKEIRFLDLENVDGIDSAGVALLDSIKFRFEGIEFINISPIVANALKVFSFQPDASAYDVRKENYFEKLGEKFINGWTELTDLMFIASDIVFWSFHDLFDRRGQRKGSFTQQSVLLGLDAVGIIVLLSIILGFIMAIQSGNQLRQFGASVFLADMLSVTMVNELGPILTAIIIAGRSGSSIASEIASMQVMEEIDALKIMAINPIRFVIVPKFHAITVCMPVLLMLSIIVSIGAGLLVGMIFLGLSPITFFNRAVAILDLRDVLVSFVKTTFFAWVIVIIGSYMGLKVKGGAEGVGKATTDSVVTSIFAVIMLDALFSFIYMV